MLEPKIRFKKDDGSFYPAWREYLIAELFTKIGNKNKDGQNTNVITNSAEFGLIPQRDYFDKDIAVEGNTGNYTIIQTGDFVYNPRKSSYAPMGPFNCYRLSDDGIVSPLYSCLRPKGILDPEYLLWYFQTNKWYGYVNDHGAQNGARHDRVGMTDKILMEIPVTAPCEEEQQKIADFLSSVDEVITASEEEVANLETQKKAVMKKVFSQEVRFKRDDGSDFPVWEEANLSEYATVIMGQSPEGSSVNDDGDGEYLIQGKADLRGYGVLPDRCTNKPTKICEPTDIIMTVRAPVGFVTEVGYKACIGRGVCAIRAGEKTSSQFIKYVLESVASLWRKIEQGTTFTAISADDVESLMVSIPCLEEQHLIADFLSDFDEAIAAAKKELELWKELKKGLLQQMFV